MSELHSAARDGNLERLTQLLAAGQAADSPDHINRTPLHLAAFAGRVECVSALLSHPGIYTACANDDVNALHFAAQKGHKEICRLLINKGLAVNGKNRKGANALILAAQNGHTEVVQLLLQRKANPRAQNRAGKTALDMAKNAEVRRLIQEALDLDRAAAAVPSTAEDHNDSCEAPLEPSEAGTSAAPTAEPGRQSRKRTALPNSPAEEAVEIGPQPRPVLVAEMPSEDDTDDRPAKIAKIGVDLGHLEEPADGELYEELYHTN